MIECLYTSNKAAQIKQQIYKRLSKENRVKNIDNDLFDQLCNYIIINFNRKIANYDEENNILRLNLPKSENDQFNDSKQYNFDQIEYLFDELNQNGKINNLNKLKNVLPDKFNLKINNKNYHKQLFKSITNTYFHHFWHMSRISSLDVYYKIINFINEFPKSELSLDNEKGYHLLQQLMQKAIPDLFILIGEIDLSDSESPLPILIQNQQFKNDLPDKYYHRIVHYSNNEHWVLSNSLTEINDFLNHINNDDLNIKYDNFAQIFNFEFLNNPKLGISKFYCKKYKNSDLMIIKIKDKNYQFEFLQPNSDFELGNEAIIDYAN